MNVVNVERLFARSHISAGITEHTQGKNRTNVMNVAKLSVASQTSLCIRAFTQGKSPMRVMNVGKLSAGSHTSGPIKELIHVGKHMNIKNGRTFYSKGSLNVINHTKGNSINVINGEKPFVSQTSTNVTQRRHPKCNAYGKTFGRSHTSQVLGIAHRGVILRDRDWLCILHIVLSFLVHTAFIFRLLLWVWLYNSSCFHM